MSKALAFESLAAPTRRGLRTTRRIVDAAARLFGAEGFQGASMDAVARAAGVSKGLLHYHFRSQEQLLIEAQRDTFRKIHERFEERFERGDRGLATALEGIDALWEAILDMRAWAPFLMQTLSLAAQDRPVRLHVDEFYRESTVLLERGVRNVFSEEVSQLALPPERLAMIIRTALHGLVVELSYARTALELSRVEQAYRDLRAFFERAVLVSNSPQTESL